MKRWKALAAENGRGQHPEEPGKDVSCAGGAGPSRSRDGVSVRAAVLGWGEGFQDTILFRDGQLANMKNYLRDNPRRLAIKRLFPGLFRQVRELGVDLCCPQPAKGYFAALGNRFLLKKQLVQVQISRSDLVYRREAKPGGGLKVCRDAHGEAIVDFASGAYCEKRDRLLGMARHGAVLLSPCVSDGERQIVHEAIAAGLSIVTMQNKGFAPVEKPVGRLFDVCAEGRLLMLAPAAWPYQPGDKKMTRFDATAMNCLCQWIAGSGAAEVNYHGMKPADIASLARAAARVVG